MAQGESEPSGAARAAASSALNHPYTASLSFENLVAIFDPFGPARLYTANYAPLHLLLIALERHIFADAMLGYHLVNVLVHAVVATLLVTCFHRAGVWPRAALLGGIFFLAHPANVEAVAWISQLKTSGSLAFALGALLALPAAPAFATLLFACSLLTKASGLFALPTAAAMVWARHVRARQSGEDGARGEVRWLIAWLAITLIYAIPQYGAFAHLGAVEVAAYGDPWVQLRTIAAVGMRYLVMAATGYGVSAFQEPSPALSWLDPWWLAALASGVLLGWRTLATLRRGSPEASFWVAAAAAFAPVSQIFPFLNPVADRYLYFILPGLIGGALLWGQDLVARASRHGAASRTRRAAVRRVATALAAAILVVFGLKSVERAALWRNETLLLLDAARHYPEGVTAYFMHARRAAQAGDARSAVAALDIAIGRGLDRFAAVRDDPGLAPIRDDPGFRQLIREMAGRWIERAHERGYHTQPELRMLGLAHRERGEYAEAIAAFRAALRVGGPQDDIVRAELLETRRAAAAGGAPDRQPDS
jgi:tetratricopeptide (TPR) repeat protein